jgi:hypothetical protein
MRATLLIAVLAILMLITACAVGNLETKTSRDCERDGPIDSSRCPMFAPPPPGWCGNGTIVAGGFDDKCCRMPPKCVQGNA